MCGKPWLQTLGLIVKKHSFAVTKVPEVMMSGLGWEQPQTCFGRRHVKEKMRTT